MSDWKSEINPFEDGSALEALRAVGSIAEAIARLQYTAEHGRPCGLLLGASGTGKSAILRLLAADLWRATHECGQIDLRRTGPSELAWHLASELGAAPATTHSTRCWRLVEDLLTGRALAGRPTYLLVDHLEAGDLAMLPDLRRLLANAEATQGWCTVLCAGRTDSVMAKQLGSQYGELRIEVGPLSLAEVDSYLQQVVATSHCASFDETAVRALHAHTQGLLRELTDLARLALIAATAEEASVVNEELVTLVRGEVACRGRLPDEQRAVATRRVEHDTGGLIASR